LQKNQLKRNKSIVKKISVIENSGVSGACSVKMKISKKMSKLKFKNI